MRRLVIALASLLAACSHHPASHVDAGSTPVDAGTVEDAGPTIPAFRCGVDLSAHLTTSGAGASVHAITDASDLLTGPAAQGKLGDYLLANDRVHVIVQGPDRHLGPQPYGGNIIDAALVGPGMHDEFGELGLLYNFGRTVNPQNFEILLDGSAGGSVVLAASGVDTVNNWLGLKPTLQVKLGEVPAVDPDAAIPLRITNYFILNPGDSRVREVSALCNDGAAQAKLAIGDLADPGGSEEFFNPDACVHGFGYSFGATCFGLDPLSWYGYQGDGVAYGYAAFKTGDPSQPEELSAVLTVSGVTGSIVSAPGLQGLLDWFNANLATHHGELDIAAGGVGQLVRDFVIGRDLGQVASIIEGVRAPLDNRSVVPISGHVTDPSGSAVAGARVAMERTATVGVETVFVTDAAGAYSGTLYSGSYQMSAWRPGSVPTAKVSVSLSGSAVTQDFTLGATRNLTVTASDGAGSPLPAKVTLMCVGPCPAPSSQLDLYTDTTRDPLPDDTQFQGFIPPAGSATFQVPPGNYQLLVSRGPLYSIWPATWPGSAYALDLTQGDATVAATLVKVIDTGNWLGADFHVHAINSPDSYVPNTNRVQAFLSEGVDALVSTDHDFVTDLSPYNAALGGQSLLATIVGEEASPMDFGHYILFPYPRVASDLNGGALDWAGGSTGPTMTLGQMFAAAQGNSASTIQFNHPRGYLGGFTYLQVDTDTLASHAPAARFRMAPATSSATDTGLMSSNFNSFELFNPGSDLFSASNAYGLLNDWFTMLSHGLLVTGTGVSDTHTQVVTAAGYWRTFVDVGLNQPSELTGTTLSQSVNAMKATVSDGPFLQVTAHRLDANGNMVGSEMEPGGIVPQGAGPVVVTVDVQVPTYMDLTRIELYTHVPADDDSCPTDPNGPNALTNRVACAGVPNLHWPASSILLSRTVQLSPSDLETAATVNGQVYQRYHHLETFSVPAPATDNWIVAMVYGSTDLFPLVYAGVDTTNARKPALPFALSNPILIDADGGGYNNPPFHPKRPPHAHVVEQRGLEHTPVTKERALEALSGAQKG